MLLKNTFIAKQADAKLLNLCDYFNVLEMKTEVSILSYVVYRNIIVKE